ncbi:MAG: hypothetical protein [Bacteriophage sp.]|nr:MAG: hypothetical protein [Bacteriophage sp.]
MSTDIKIQNVLSVIKQHEIRVKELQLLRAAVHGNTQIDFKLTAGSASMPISLFDRDYLYKVKPVYNMVRLGLLKGLESEIDTHKDLIKEKQIELSNLYNDKSVEMKELSEQTLRR